MIAPKSLLSVALGTAAAGLDRAVLVAAQLRNARRPGRLARLGHDARLAALAAIAEAYDADAAEPFFAAPPAIGPRLELVRHDPDARVFDASWASGYEPWGDSARHRYLAHTRNRTAHARLYLGERPRPAIIVIHGYLGGSYRSEERAWPVAWLGRIGLDVAMPVLPFHALRGEGPSRFPGPDPSFTNEGFRQAVHDVRALAAWLRDRGAPAVGVMGMSLGGYTTSLLATIERDLAFAVPMIPLASIADFAREQGRLGSDPGTADELHRALERANRVVSPLARPSLIPRERLLVIAAAADRITPIAHARRLARHFDARLMTMPGGHLLQIGRGDAFREVARLLGRLGILPPRSARETA